jgi:hypothetical protein
MVADVLPRRIPSRQIAVHCGVSEPTMRTRLERLFAGGRQAWQLAHVGMGGWHVVRLYRQELERGLDADCLSWRMNEVQRGHQLVVASIENGMARRRLPAAA